MSPSYSPLEWETEESSNSEDDAEAEVELYESESGWVTYYAVTAFVVNAAAAAAIPAAHPLPAGVHGGANMPGTSATHALAGAVGEPSEVAVSMGQGGS